MSRDIITELQLEIAALRRQLAEQDEYIRALKAERDALWNDPIGYKRELEERSRNFFNPSPDKIAHIMRAIGISEDVIRAHAGQRPPPPPPPRPSLPPVTPELQDYIMARIAASDELVRSRAGQRR